ncbi:hypothetical protein B7G68_07625 [Caulobacter segnis]|uniref:Uncharacterized protein n=1 Tax=Caulobacter segnis TaxID=88688 RepID=A0ABN5IRV1_9CAUL|nr:hypothetical protein B7G68_07625 [Caulobacter segnis]
MTRVLGNLGRSPSPVRRSHPYISRRDDRRAVQVTQGRRYASPRSGRRSRSLTDLVSPARCSLQEM